MSTTENSLIINFTLPIINTTGTFVDIFINNILIHREYSKVDGLYIAPIEVGDNIRVEIRNLDPYNQRAGLDVYRKNYTTDDINGDNGITTDYITGYTASAIVTGVTFSDIIVQPNNSSYHLEYLLNINANRYNPVTPSGDFVILNASIDASLNHNVWYILSDYGSTTNVRYLNSLCDFPDVSPINNSSAINTNGDVIYIGCGFGFASPRSSFAENRFNKFLLKSMDFGVTFQPIYTFPNSNSILQVSTSYTGQFVAVYCYEEGSFPLNYRLYFSDNYGTNWNLYTIGTGYSFNNMTIDRTNGFPMYFTSNGVDTYTYKLSSSGGTITQIANIPQGAWSYYFVSDDTKYHFVVAAGYGTTNGKFLLSTNSGNTFNQVFSSMTFYNRPLVDMSSNGQYILIQNQTNQTMYLSSDYGSTLNIIRTGPINGLTMSSTGQYIYTERFVTPNVFPWFLEASVDYGATFQSVPFTENASLVIGAINTN